MKNLVRGGVILSSMALFVVFIYAGSGAGTTLSSANDSHFELNTYSTTLSTEAVNTEVSLDDTKLIKKTASKAAAGSSSKAKGSFVATAYCLRGRTAMGHGVRRGIIAADPRVLRLGSKINLTAGQYTGEYLVSDTGGLVKGRKIDIWVPSCAEARRFGRRTVQVN